MNEQYLSKNKILKSQDYSVQWLKNTFIQTYFKNVWNSHSSDLEKRAGDLSVFSLVRPSFPFSIETKIHNNTRHKLFIYAISKIFFFKMWL